MDLDKMFSILVDDVVFVFYSIQEYKKIFINDNANIPILDKTASNYFLSYHRMFWNNLILSIGRLTDPYIQGNNNNLSIDVILKYAETKDLECKDQIKEKIESVRNQISKIKTWRHKFLAHRDVESALKQVNSEIKIELLEIENIMNSIGTCINLVYGESESTTMDWHVVTHKDAESLLYFLDEGLIYKSIKEERNNWKLDDTERNKFSIRTGNGA